MLIRIRIANTPDFLMMDARAGKKILNTISCFLRSCQQYANDKLKADGYLFLNDVYDMLGIPRSKAGQIVGWVYDPKNPIGDNYVDFGIYDINREKNRDFVNGYERTILLDFNVDGNILDLI